MRTQQQKKGSARELGRGIWCAARVAKRTITEAVGRLSKRDSSGVSPRGNAQAANWTELYALLDSDKEIVNSKPEMREYHESWM